MDGWALPVNEKLGITVATHTGIGERRDAAKACCSCLKMTIPIVLDEIDDRVGIAYSGMPDRLYVVDTQGRVAYKGGRGPFGFEPSEMEQALLLLLVDESLARTGKAP